MIELDDLQKAEALRALVLKRKNRMAQLVQKCVEDSKNPEVKPSWSTPKLFASSSSLMTIDPDLRQMARERVNEKVESEYFEDPELQKLWSVLLSNSNRGPPNIPRSWWLKNVEHPIRKSGYLRDDHHMDFFYYQKSQLELGPKFEHLLTPKLFFILQAASEPVAKKMNRIRSFLVFRYIVERNYNKIQQMRLYKNDALGTGYLTEEGLKNFLLDYEPFQLQFFRAPQFRNEYYLTVAVRRFFFFLDPQRKGRIRIADIQASGLIDEIRFPEEERRCAPADGVVDWFSLKTANKIYNHFEKLDQNFKGMLSQADFLKFGLDLRRKPKNSDGDKNKDNQPLTQLTPTFINRLFNNVPTIGGLMDFANFTEFVLANTYLYEPQSIAYFVRMFDRKGKGFLDEFDLHCLFRDIQSRIGGEAYVNFADIRNDIFDMVKPSTPGKITAKDIFKCRKSPAIIEMLISVTGFENFESLDLGDIPLAPEPQPPAQTEIAETIQLSEEENEIEKMMFKKQKKKSSKRARVNLQPVEDDEEAVKSDSPE